MKVLITMKLYNRSVMYHLYPLSLCDEIEKIIVVRDFEGPAIHKVTYLCPPTWALKVPAAAALIRLWHLVRLSFSEKPLFIHSYLLVPHGILALIAGKVTRTPVGVSLLSGPIELYSPWNRTEKKYSYTRALPPITFVGRTLLRILTRIDHVNVAGSYTRDFLLDHGVPEENIFDVKYTVVDNDCLPAPHLQKIYDLVYVGRLADSKRVDIAIKVVNKLVGEFHLDDLRFAVVGEGPCRERLERLSENLGLSSNVGFLGFQDDVAAIYKRSKVSIITSERETGPLTAIESLLCGVPVVSTGCGDTVNDLIVDGENGFLVRDAEDIDEFASKVQYLLSHEEVRSEFSHRALAVPEVHGHDRVAEQWRAIIAKRIMSN